MLEPAGDTEPAGLDPATGREALRFPEEGSPRRGERSSPVLLRADRTGAVAAAGTGGGGLLLRRSAPDGGVVAEVRPEGVRFDDVGFERAAVLEDTALLPVLGEAANPGREGRRGCGRCPWTGEGRSRGPWARTRSRTCSRYPGARWSSRGDEYGPTGLRGVAL